MVVGDGSFCVGLLIRCRYREPFCVERNLTDDIPPRECRLLIITLTLTAPRGPADLLLPLSFPVMSLDATPCRSFQVLQGR
jgi:hypothetical protein